MKKSLFIPILITVIIIAAGVMGVTAARAQDSGSYPPFIQSLADRFGLNAQEVKTFFEVERQERQQVMQQSREEKLNQAVTDGVITEELKQALMNKWEDVKQEREQHREDMQAWFAEQGIDAEALKEYGGFGHLRGFAGHGMWK